MTIAEKTCGSVTDRFEENMSPTAIIARDMNDAEILRRMGRDTYQKYHRNVAAAKERAARLKEQKR